MAVQRGTFTETQGEITITNGDFQALRKIAQDYNISDETDVITFAIGVLSRANGRAVTIEQEDGSALKLMPSAKLRGTNP
ncbi:MAG: hypothetical protein WC783_05700 [Candidatus Paceibacterota bacterium]|jgi:hypothetical protein